MIPDNDLLVLQARVAKNPELQKDPAVMKKVAQEIESLFVQELLKVMREGSGEGLFSKGLGSDIFSGIFDGEIAKKISEKGIGLGDVIMKSIITHQAQETGNNDDPGAEIGLTDRGKDSSVKKLTISENFRKEIKVPRQKGR
jgi:Rod binding domain-containing protein